MSWVYDKPKQYRRKPPVVKAFRFDREDGAAHYWANQYLSCTYLDVGQYRSTPMFYVERDKHMDWVEAKIIVDGSELIFEHRERAVEVGSWIVINETEDIVEFMSDYQFKARYEEIS